MVDHKKLCKTLDKIFTESEGWGKVEMTSLLVNLTVNVMISFLEEKKPKDSEELSYFVKRFLQSLSGDVITALKGYPFKFDEKNK
jgi:hypothetical protein